MFVANDVIKSLSQHDRKTKSKPRMASGAGLKQSWVFKERIRRLIKLQERCFPWCISLTNVLWSSVHPFLYIYCNYFVVNLNLSWRLGGFYLLFLFKKIYGIFKKVLFHVKYDDRSIERENTHHVISGNSFFKRNNSPKIENSNAFVEFLINIYCYVEKICREIKNDDHFRFWMNYSLIQIVCCWALSFLPVHGQENTLK